MLGIEKNKKIFSEISVFEDYRVYTIKDLEKIGKRNFLYLTNKKFYMLWSYNEFYNMFDVGSYVWFFEEDKRRLSVEYWNYVKNPYEINSKLWLEEEKVRKVEIYRKLQDEVKIIISFINIFGFSLKMFFNKNIIIKPSLRVITILNRESNIVLLDKVKQEISYSSTETLNEKTLELVNFYKNFVQKNGLSNTFLEYPSLDFDVITLYKFYNKYLKKNLLFKKKNKLFFVSDNIKDNKEEENKKKDNDDRFTIISKQKGHTGPSWGGEDKYQYGYYSTYDKLKLFFKRWRFSIKKGFKNFSSYIRFNFFYFDLKSLSRNMDETNSNLLFVTKYRDLYVSYNLKFDKRLNEIVDGFNNKKKKNVEELDLLNEFEEEEDDIYRPRVIRNKIINKSKVLFYEELLYYNNLEIEMYNFMYNKDLSFLEAINLDLIIKSFFGLYYENRLNNIFDYNFLVYNTKALILKKELFIEKNIVEDILLFIKRFSLLDTKKVAKNYIFKDKNNLIVYGDNTQREFVFNKMKRIERFYDINISDYSLYIIYSYFNTFRNNLILYNTENLKQNINHLRTWYMIPFDYFGNVDFYDFILFEFLKTRIYKGLLFFHNVGDFFYESKDYPYILKRTSTGFFKYNNELYNKTLSEEGIFGFEDKYTYFSGFILYFKIFYHLENLVKNLNYLKNGDKKI